MIIHAHASVTELEAVEAEAAAISIGLWAPSEHLSRDRKFTSAESIDCVSRVSQVSLTDGIDRLQLWLAHKDTAVKMRWEEEEEEEEEEDGVRAFDCQMNE